VRLAASESLAAESLARFDSFFAEMAADTVPPHVVILLVASPDVLEEKIALRDRQSADRGAIGAGPHSGMAACATMDEAVARLLRLQDRIAAELRSPETNVARGPRAVVTITAGDFEQAVQEAVAVVEAMV